MRTQPVLLLAAVLFNGAATAGQHAPARAVTISELTVPQARLSEGCGLSPAASVVDGNRVQGGLWANLPIPTNPWTGTDRRTIASLRQTMGGVPIADAPLTAQDASRYTLRLAEGVEEGYAAVYAQSATDQIVVRAFRYDSARPALDAPMPAAIRVDVGPLVAFISGNAGPCFRAVEAYLRSLDPAPVRVVR